MMNFRGNDIQNRILYVSRILTLKKNNNIDEELEKIEKLWIKMGKKEEHKKIESLMRKGFQYGLIKKFLSQN